MNIFKSTGKLIFDPLPLTGSAEKMFKPGWVIVRTDGDIDDYYRWFMFKEKGLILQSPAWGPHISIVRGEDVSAEIWEKKKAELNNSTVHFEYENFPKSNGVHWWLKVYCEELKYFRRDLGLTELPKWTFHLTLGLPIPRLQEHSQYIFRLETQM